MKKRTTTQVSLTEPDAERLTIIVQSRRQRPDAPRALPLLEQKLSDAEFHTSESIPRNVVTMNSTVLLRDLDSGAQIVATLAYPHGANPDRGRISVMTPIGTALLGVKVPNIVECTTPGGLKRYQIERIIYQPEASNESDN